jgi:Universal stress protein family
VPVEHAVTAGEAGQVIAEHADRVQADLIVLGSPIDELRDEDCKTSTVLQVVSNVSCPVLCVPSTRDVSHADAINKLAIASTKCTDYLGRSGPASCRGASRTVLAG